MNEKRINRNRQYSILIILCILLITSSIPFSMFISNENTVILLSILMKVLFLLFFFIYRKHENLFKSSIEKPSLKLLFFLPFFLVSFSNLFVVLINKDTEVVVNNPIYVSLNIIYYLFVSITEELVFRSLIIPEIGKYKNKLNVVIISSLIFGLVHIVNINSLSSIPYVLLQVVYSFFLGLILSFMYLETKNIILPIMLHFSFDVINGFLVPLYFDLSMNVVFYIVSIAFALVFVIYGIILFNKFNRKEE